MFQFMLLPVISIYQERDNGSPTINYFIMEPIGYEYDYEYDVVYQPRAMDIQEFYRYH